MLAATVLILGAFQPPAINPMAQKPVISQVEQQANDARRRHYQLQQRSENTDQEIEDTLKSIERRQKEIKEMIEKFEQMKKSKQK